MLNVYFRTLIDQLLFINCSAVVCSVPLPRTDLWTCSANWRGDKTNVKVYGRCRCGFRCTRCRRLVISLLFMHGRVHTSYKHGVCLSVCHTLVIHSFIAALDQLRVIASSTSNDPGPRSRQHQQIGQCLLPLAAANFFVDHPAGASSQWREEC